MTFIGKQCNDSDQGRAQFDEDQAGCPIPYYPEFDHLQTAVGISINQRDYIGSKDEQPANRRIERATPEGIRRLS